MHSGLEEKSNLDYKDFGTTTTKKHKNKCQEVNEQKIIIILCYIIIAQCNRAALVS